MAIVKLEETVLVLPKPRFSEFGHLDNIRYCIEILQQNTGSVIFYRIERGLRTTHRDHKCLPEYLAGIENDPNRFDYHTLGEFEKRLKEIEEGKYKLYNGLIIGFSKKNRR